MGGGTDDSAVHNNDSWVIEFTLLSGQSLTPPPWSPSLSLLGRRMRAYAVVWVHERARFFTGIDEIGGSQPSWNHTFLFKLDTKFLTNKKIKLNIAIYAAGAGLIFNDRLIGSCHLSIKLCNSTAPYMGHCFVHRYENGVPLVQGLIHVKSRVMPYEQFYPTINTIFGEALQDRISLMSIDAQHEITALLPPQQLTPEPPSSNNYWSSDDLLILKDLLKLIYDLLTLILVIGFCYVLLSRHFQYLSNRI